MKTDRQYICIDLKSFYASVEAVERGLDPLDVNLIVADASRTEKTIGLALSPSLKAYGLSGRARLFEVVQKIREVNRERLNSIPDRRQHSHGTANLDFQTSSSRIITRSVAELYDRISNPSLLVRRLTLCANRIVPESEAKRLRRETEINLFTDIELLERQTFLTIFPLYPLVYWRKNHYFCTTINQIH